MDPNVTSFAYVVIQSAVNRYRSLCVVGLMLNVRLVRVWLITICDSGTNLAPRSAE